MFTFLLKSTMASVDRFDLTEGGFELVLYLFNSTLMVMEQKIANYMTTEVLVKKKNDFFYFYFYFFYFIFFF